jgi:hypothetical protein
MQWEKTKIRPGTLRKKIQFCWLFMDTLFIKFNDYSKKVLFFLLFWIGASFKKIIKNALTRAITIPTLKILVTEL